MAYDGKIMRRAQARFEADRQARQEQMAERRQILYTRIPRLRQIEQELQGTMGQIISSALRRGTDPLPALRVIRDNNLALQDERRELLRNYGYDENYLDDAPLCPHCGDSGYSGGRVCDCLRRYYAAEQIAELSSLLPMGEETFETFDFHWYSPERPMGLRRSPRETAEHTFDVCQDYAYQFSPRSGNLLLFGDPGLGKTFLSAAIARVVSENGHSVVYDTAGRIFQRYEDAKFRADEAVEEDIRRYEGCDLLIIDDLGTEMNSSFVQSAFYQLLNGRLVRGRKTIINTNLKPDQLGQRYGAAVRSRIEGEFELLPFVGEDIRKLKKGK